MRYLANAFSLSMVPGESMLVVKPIDKEEFCAAISEPSTINAIGHQGTADLINMLCNAKITVNRIMVKANYGDEIYVIQVMTRLEEGKVLSLNELMELLNKGLIKFYKVTVQKP